MPARVYTVACAICPFTQECPTQTDGDVAAVQHEHDNTGHVAYVRRPDMTQEAV